MVVRGTAEISTAAIDTAKFAATVGKAKAVCNRVLNPDLRKDRNIGLGIGLSVDCGVATGHFRGLTYFRNLGFKAGVRDANTSAARFIGTRG
jgi:hypothetical protein